VHVHRVEVTRAVESLVVTRVIQYVAHPGQEPALLDTLQRSLVGRVETDGMTITAAVVDDLSPRQQDILGLLGRQPGVWLARRMGGADRNALKAILVPHQYSSPPEAILRYGETPGREETHRGKPFIGEQHLYSQRPFKGERMTDSPPNTGPAFSPAQGAMAQAITLTCGLQVAYTIALALQNYSELVKGESFEPHKQLTSEECLQMANAIMQLIPDDWDPVMEPAPTETLGDA
jgi:hypothetical protein